MIRASAGCVNRHHATVTELPRDFHAAPLAQRPFGQQPKLWEIQKYEHHESAASASLFKRTGVLAESVTAAPSPH